MPPSSLLAFLQDTQPAFASKARLSSLYADFTPLRATNPDGFGANVEAWRNALLEAAKAGVLPGQDTLSIHTGEQLAAALEIKGLGRPLALQAVIDDAISRREVIPYRDFLEHKTSFYEKSWMPQAVAQLRLPTIGEVARWSLRQIGIGVRNADGRLEEGNVVVFKNVEDAAKAILTAVRATSTSPSALIFSSTTFAATFSTILSPTHPLSTTDINALLIHLQRDHRAISLSPPSSTTPEATIKFSPNPIIPPAPVTAHDTTIAALNTLLLSLTTQAAALNARIASLHQTALEAISATPPQKTRARTALRSKKLAETTLEQREAGAAQVRRTLDGIDEAAGQVEIVRAMGAGADVLRSLREDMGGVEGVSDVVEKSRQEMEFVDEMTGIIAGGGVVVDEDAVDDEFERMEKEERERSRLAMPNAPKEEPKVQVSEGDEATRQMEKSLSSMSLDEDAKLESRQAVPSA